MNSRAELNLYNTPQLPLGYSITNTTHSSLASTRPSLHPKGPLPTLVNFFMLSVLSSQRKSPNPNLSAVLFCTYSSIHDKPGRASPSSPLKRAPAQPSTRCAAPTSPSSTIPSRPQSHCHPLSLFSSHLASGWTHFFFSLPLFRFTFHSSHNPSLSPASCPSFFFSPSPPSSTSFRFDTQQQPISLALYQPPTSVRGEKGPLILFVRPYAAHARVETVPEPTFPDLHVSLARRLLLPSHSASPFHITIIASAAEATVKSTQLPTDPGHISQPGPCFSRSQPGNYHRIAPTYSTWHRYTPEHHRPFIHVPA